MKEHDKQMETKIDWRNEYDKKEETACAPAVLILDIKSCIISDRSNKMA
jgi:hypothetical protein